MRIWNELMLREVRDPLWGASFAISSIPSTVGSEHWGLGRPHCSFKTEIDGSVGKLKCVEPHCIA